MVKTETKKEILYQDTVISEECRCDRCGRHLWFHTKDGYSKQGLKNTVYYYHIITGHHDWGRDSIDSIETYDVCSGCAKKMYEEYIEDSFNRENSLYFECSHECTWDEHEEEEEE